MTIVHIVGHPERAIETEIASSSQRLFVPRWKRRKAAPARVSSVRIQVRLRGMELSSQREAGLDMVGASGCSLAAGINNNLTGTARTDGPEGRLSVEQTPNVKGEKAERFCSVVLSLRSPRLRARVEALYRDRDSRLDRGPSTPLRSLRDRTPAQDDRNQGSSLKQT